VLRDHWNYAAINAHQADDSVNAIFDAQQITHPEEIEILLEHPDRTP
jgi:hypothetical protein